MANLSEWLERMEVYVKAKLLEENASLKREVAELRGEIVRQTKVYITESDQLRKTNDKLCRQLKEKEQLLAEVTRDVAKAQGSNWTAGETVSGPPESFGLPSDQRSEQGRFRVVKATDSTFSIESGEAKGSKLASRVIGTPKADDIEKALGEESNSTRHQLADALQTRRRQEQEQNEIAEDLAASARCGFLTEQRVREIAKEEAEVAEKRFYSRKWIVDGFPKGVTRVYEEDGKTVRWEIPYDFTGDLKPCIDPLTDFAPSEPEQ